ncbi:LIC_10190 family membrane protein [Chamaesiphon minutus]|uniref:DUF8201 domain-containing protein n=1 Tax=Chamaesiphon minutus (strain ATCC 27169 / PCC 6605) TaxID=1173020 RepID=K9UP25_CHAP6|nr:hypothetical protein [Chamaesiphon minutus]AFY96575.1 hypothetical protein Cha6605_5718 [Chamaesiphon minutus PCC 6605]
MLYFISVWTLLLIGCYSCGLGLLNLLEIKISRENSPFSRLGDRVIISTWLGMLAISIGLLAIALFIPLSPSIGCLVFSILLLISLRSRSTRLEIFALYRQISRTQILVYLGVAIAIATRYAQPVQWYDSGLYHYSLLRWLSNFGTVPGLALLFANLGFTSAWFAFSAPLNPDWSIDRTGATANGFVFLLVVLHVALCGWRLIRQQGRLSDWFVVIYDSCLLLFMTIRISVMPDILVSPSPDIAAVLMVAVVAWTILVIETEDITERFTLSRQIVPLFLAVGAVSIKLTTLPLLFVTGLWFLIRAGYNPHIIQRMAIAAAATLLLTPLLLSNLVTSGCPLYPSTAFCLDLPWTVRGDLRIANDTHHWIDWYGKPPAGIHPWLWAFQHWLKNSGKKASSLTMAISAGCAIYLLKTRQLSAIDRLTSIWQIEIACVGISFFLLTSPLNRFMVPYLFLLPGFAVATYCHTRFSTNPIGAKVSIERTTPVAIFLLLIVAIATTLQVRSNYLMLILPPAIDRFTTVEHQVNDVIYLSPVDGKNRGCWTNELPCAYDPTQVKLRDPSQGIKAGFVRS